MDVFIQLFRPTDNCVSAPVPFQFKPRSTTMTRKRARISSANNSADLPTVLGGHFSFATISKEFNTIGLIDECLHNAMPSEDLEKLIRYTITNSDGNIFLNIHHSDFILFSAKLIKLSLNFVVTSAQKQYFWFKNI